MVVLQIGFGGFGSGSRPEERADAPTLSRSFRIESLYIKELYDTVTTVQLAFYYTYFTYDIRARTATP